MQKSLLRHLRRALRKAAPAYSAKLVRILGEMVDGASNRQQLESELRRFIAYVISGLRKRGLPEDYIFSQAAIVATAGLICADHYQAMWLMLAASVKLSKEQLKSTLHKNLIPEKIDLVFEQIKYSLWDRWWSEQIHHYLDSIPHPPSLVLAGRFHLRFCPCPKFFQNL